MSTKSNLADAVVVERTLNAPVAKVWKALTDVDQMRQWYFDLKKFRPEVGFEFEFVPEDIQVLNEWALEGRLEVTALSLATYPLVQHRYALLPHGASIGSGYGPIVVAREELSPDDLQGVEIAVPGRLTTAFLVLGMAEFRNRLLQVRKRGVSSVTVVSR